MTNNNTKGFFGKVKLVAKRFVKGMIFPAAFCGVVGMFIPGVLTSKMLISSLIKGGLLSVGFGFLNDATWKVYDHMLQKQAEYAFS